MALPTHEVDVDSGPLLVVLGHSCAFAVAAVVLGVLSGGGGGVQRGGPRAAELQLQLAGEEGPQVADRPTGWISIDDWMSSKQSCH